MFVNAGDRAVKLWWLDQAGRRRDYVTHLWEIAGQLSGQTVWRVRAVAEAGRVVVGGVHLPSQTR